MMARYSNLFPGLRSRTNAPLATVGGGFLDGYAGKANNYMAE